MTTATQQNLASLATSELTNLFEAGRLPDAPFTHLDHVRVAWQLLARHELGAALQRMTEGVTRLAAQRGLADLYHATITTFSMLAVAEARSRQPAEASFETFEAGNPELLSNSRGFLLSFYDAETLDSSEARSAFRMPDRWRRMI